MKKTINEYITKENVQKHTERILEKANHLAIETHMKHVTIKDRHHRPFIAFPMTLGIAAALLMPLIATIGLAAFLINDWKIDVEKKEKN